MIFVKMGQFKSLRETEKGQKRIARSILLAHKVPQTINKFLVLVEGIDDLPIYRKFFDMNKVDIKDCNGCEHVKVVHDTIKQEREGNKPFLSILDGDFNQLNGNVPFDSNVFYTDYHDSELLISGNKQVRYKVFKDLLPKVKAIDIRERAQKELFYVSFAKWFNVYRHLSFKFEGLDLINCMPNQVISESVALQYFKPSPNGISKFPFKAFRIFQSKNRNPNLDQLTNGHDLITRMAGILRKKYQLQISDKDLRDRFCKAFENSHAQKTKLYKNIASWSKQNNLHILS